MVQTGSLRCCFELIPEVIVSALLKQHEWGFLALCNELFNDCSVDCVIVFQFVFKMLERFHRHAFADLHLALVIDIIPHSHTCSQELSVVLAISGTHQVGFRSQLTDR